jgi:hypothetical protein
VTFEKKYAVSKRKQQIGTFTAKEIIKLLKIRELSTIHKVKVEDREITVGEFVTTHEAGDLPEQQISKPTPEETKPKETEPKRVENAAPKFPSSSAQPVRPKPPPSPPPSKPKPNLSDPVPPTEPRQAPPPTTTGIPSEIQSKSTDHKPVLSIKTNEDSRQRISKLKRHENSGVKKDRSRSYPDQKSRNPILRCFGFGVSLIKKALLIGMFIIIAYVGTSLLNHHRLKKDLETFLQQALQLENLDMSGFTLEGYYLIDDPRKGTVEILRNGERRSYEFKVTGNGITGSVKLDME